MYRTPKELHILCDVLSSSVRSFFEIVRCLTIRQPMPVGCSFYLVLAEVYMVSGSWQFI